MKTQIATSELVVFESALFRTTISLIIGDDYILLIDPNYLPIELQYIQQWINGHVSNKSKYLLFTHSDYDHIVGYGQFRDYKTMASARFVDNPKKKDILNRIVYIDDDNYIRRDYEIKYPSIDIIIDKDPSSLMIGSDQYLMYQARGHNRDSIIIFNQTKGLLCAGDYLSNIEFPYLYDSLSEYRLTLNKLTDIIDNNTIQMLIPGHGDITNDQSEIKKRIQDSEKYLDELEHALMNNIEFDLKVFLSQYDFPQIMTKFHNANVHLIKKELGIN